MDYYYTYDVKLDMVVGMAFLYDSKEYCEFSALIKKLIFYLCLFAVEVHYDIHNYNDVKKDYAHQDHAPNVSP